MDNVRNTWKNKPGVIILSVLLILVILMLLAVLLVRGIINKNDSRSSTEAPVASVTFVATSAEQIITPTTTNTKVVVATKAASTATPFDTPPPKRVTATPTKRLPTATKTASPKTINTPTPNPAPTDTPTAIPSEQSFADILNNGHFDAEFDNNGVATGWSSFNTDGAIISFEAETAELSIENGDFAQRITIAESTKQDSYAGIYQTITVVPGGSYSMTLYGQIRTPFGDVEKSNYGYRMQYAIDWNGGTDWQAIPAAEWIELPWDEQLINGEHLFFLDYATEVIPPNDTMTLFVRAWKKWPNDVGGQFTLDSFTLDGPVPTAMADNALPETGGVERHTSAFADPRVWVSVLILLVLLGGALWQQRHAFRR